MGFFINRRKNPVERPDRKNKIHFMTKNITFTLPAEAIEGATEVILLGDFNNWSPADDFKLEMQQDGSFKTIVALEVGQTYQYRFLMNDGRWLNDWNAQNYAPVYDLYIENSVITISEATNEAVPKKASEKPEAKKTPAPKNDKAPKEAVTAKSAVPESKIKSPAAPKSAKAKPAAEKVKAKAEKPVKDTKKQKTVSKETPKK